MKFWKKPSKIQKTGPSPHIVERSELAFIEYLNLATDFAALQTNEADKFLIADYIESFGKIVQTAFKAAKGNAIAKLMFFSGLEGELKRFETLANQFDARLPYLPGAASFEAANQKLAGMLDDLMNQMNQVG